MTVKLTPEEEAARLQALGLREGLIIGGGIVDSIIILGQYIWNLILGVIKAIIDSFGILWKLITGGYNDGYSLQEERDNTFALQDQCHNLLKGDFSKAKWDACTTSAQKQNFLTRLFNGVQGIMGTSISRIEFVNDGVDPYFPMRGRYTSRGGQPDNVLRINADYFNESNSYELAYTIIHEVRHAFQQEAVLGLNSHVVCQDTIDHWAKNLPSYAQGHQPPGYYQGDINKYNVQALEWDAKNFAKQYDDLTYIDVNDNYKRKYYNADLFPDDYLVRFYAGIWGKVPLIR